LVKIAGITRIRSVILPPIIILQRMDTPGKKLPGKDTIVNLSYF
jgi:hypothetical protein